MRAINGGAKNATREPGKRQRQSRRQTCSGDHDGDWVVVGKGEIVRTPRLEPVNDIRANEYYYLVELADGKWYGFHKGAAEVVKSKRFAFRFQNREQADGVVKNHQHRFPSAKIVLWRRGSEFSNDVPAPSG